MRYSTPHSRRRDNTNMSHDPFESSQYTVAELITAGEAYLSEYPLVYGHGTDNAFDESAWLVLEACGISPVEPVQSYEIPVTQDQLLRARQWFKKRAHEKVPVAYLTGRAWFAGLEFTVDERALIPRSPMAELIHSEFAPWLTEAPGKALDLCCGGGCIAIALASALPDCTVDAVDLSPDALELAAINVEKHRLQGRVKLHQGDLFTPLTASRQYDLIVSNPPYVDAEDMHNLAEEFSHEPQMGLAAGTDGLEIVAQMFAQAKGYLKPDGVMFVEVGNSEQALESRFGHLGLVWIDFEFGGDGVFMINAASL